MASAEGLAEPELQMYSRTMPLEINLVADR